MHVQKATCLVNYHKFEFSHHQRYPVLSPRVMMLGTFVCKHLESCANFSNIHDIVCKRIKLYKIWKIKSELLITPASFSSFANSTRYDEGSLPSLLPLRSRFVSNCASQPISRSLDQRTPDGNRRIAKSCSGNPRHAVGAARHVGHRQPYSLQ